MVSRLFIISLFLFPYSLQSSDCKVLKPEISQTYEGKCRRNLAHGFGTARGEDYFEGQFRKGLPHGTGVYVWSNGDTYAGEFRNGMKHGLGRYTIAESDSAFVGLWNNDKFVRIVDLKEKEEPNYKIYYQRNLTRTRFARTGDGNKVLFSLADGGGNRPASAMNIFGTSGFQINYGRFFGFEDVTFPFEGRISFTAPSRSGLVVYQIELFFTINQPGIWEITLTY